MLCFPQFSPNWPTGSIPVPIRSRPLIGLSELCLIDENSKEVRNLQSPDGLLDENSEEVHNLHHNLQYPDGLLDDNSEEVHNLQSPDEQMCSWRPSELVLDEKLSITCAYLRILSLTFPKVKKLFHKQIWNKDVHIFIQNIFLERFDQYLKK